MMLNGKYQTELQHRAEAEAAFELAILEGRLSADQSRPNYAGNYMYMGHSKGKDHFKHIASRDYLS